MSRLIPRQEWESTILSLKSKVIFSDFSQAKKAVSDSLLSAVKKSIPKERFAILFSGGVDSTLLAFLCKKLGADFLCCSVGMEGSADIEAARYVSEDLSLPLKYKTYTDVGPLLAKTVAILGEEHSNVVNVGVGMVECAALEIAAAKGIKHVFTGLGSEEIFAGYQRHELSDDINEECWTGLLAMWGRDLVREHQLSSAFDMKMHAPFLDSDLVRVAMQVPGEYKIRDGVKKYVLREVAKDLGMPEDIAGRPKKAAQYGSSFDRAMLNLAKRNGFRFKTEYLRYIIKNNATTTRSKPSSSRLTASNDLVS